MTKGPVAALDCGTNSTRLLILDASGRTLARCTEITRLGQGVDVARRIVPEAIARTVAVLERYRAEMDHHGVVAARLAATSAARDAANSAEVLDAFERVSGVKVEVLTGEEEGSLAFAGATADLPPWDGRGGEPELVIDIGGGSTELIAGIPGVAQPAAPESVAGVPGSAQRGPDPSAAPRAVSLDMGCVRVTERFLRHDPPLPVEIADATAMIDELLEGAKLELAPVLQGTGLELPDRLIGLAGTVSTLASLVAGLPSYDRKSVHHLELERETVDEWLARLAAEDMSARLERPGMVRGREDVIVGGVLVLSRAMDRFGRQVCLTSEDDILDGLAATLLAGAGSAGAAGRVGTGSGRRDD